MEILREAPKPSSFVPLIEHQSTTPASFYTGPPVLHYYSDRSKLVVLDHEAQSVSALAPLLEHAQPQGQAQDSETNGSSGVGAQKTIPDLDIYVTSDKLLLYSSTADTGLSIPYPSISLHAIQSLPQPAATDQQGLYMQVISQPSSIADDEEPESISLTIIPTASAPPPISNTVPGTTETGLEVEDKTEQTPVQAMFNALSACSNLHPDPVEDEDDDAAGGQSRLFSAGLAIPGTSDGGLPPAMPGSGGWITAENMHEFIDENGNWIEGDEEMVDEEARGGGEPLGPGAGTVRRREDEGEEDAIGHENGNGAGNGDGDETKWRRTE